MVLSSVGYQGSTPKDFFSVLKENNIGILVDVRENPVSRKKGFSKSALKLTSEENGIKYFHFASLGSRRETRKEYKENKNWGWFSAQYNQYLETQEDVIGNLFEIISEGNTCLMCFESDHNLCHRSLLIDHLLEDSIGVLDIKHLTLA